MTDTPENVRPWGRYDAIDSGRGYQVKRIVVKPGQRLSYQSHRQRSEFWTVVNGQAVVTLNDELIELSVGQSVEIPVGAKHRVANPGEKKLIFIEVQVGDYLGEDDIERYADDYGR